VRFAKQLMNKLQRLLRRRSEPQDPYSYVTAGLKRGPSGRSTAVALEDPTSRRLLNLFGRRVND
jgi:hypothetical protein